MEKNKIIYLDNYLTTPIDNKVKEVIKKNLDAFLQPVRFIKQGVNVEKEIYKVKEIISKSLEITGENSNTKNNERDIKNKNISPNNIYFFPNGTHTLNFLIRGIVESYIKKGKDYKDLEILVDSITCPDITLILRKLSFLGINIKKIKVDNKGNILINDLKNKLSDKTKLVITSSVNHILGTIQDLESIGKTIKKFNREILFFVDNQIGYFKNINYLNKALPYIDIITTSGEKIYGPVISAAYIKNETKVSEYIRGNGISKFEKGVLNLPYILGLGKAVKLKIRNYKEEIKKVKELRDYLYKKIIKEIKDVELFGPEINKNRDYSNLLLSFKYVEGESIYMDLSFDNIIVSTTSACASENLETNYVILAIGKKHEDAHGSLRITLNKYNTREEIDFFVEKLKESIDRLRSFSSFTEDYDYEAIKNKSKK